jgi:hypothetical protein
MAGAGMPGMGPPPIGAGPAGGPGGDPMVLELLRSIQGKPAPAGDQAALKKATALLGQALSSIALRAPKASVHIAKAMHEISSAQDLLESEPGMPTGGPPDLLGGLTPAPMGGPGITP